MLQNIKIAIVLLKDIATACIDKRNIFMNKKSGVDRESRDPVRQYSYDGRHTEKKIKKNAADSMDIIRYRIHE